MKIRTMSETRDHCLRTRWMTGDGAIGVRRVSLFGSAARGNVLSRSDVDVAIDFEPEARVGLFELVEMRDELAVLFGRPVDLGTWSSMRPGVRQRGERDAVTLYQADD